LNIRYTFRTSEKLRLALKNRVAQKFFDVWNILFTFRIFEQLVLALKNSVALIFSLYKHVFLLFRSFEQPALALKKQSCPEIFRCIEYTLYILNF